MQQEALSQALSQNLAGFSTADDAPQENQLLHGRNITSVLPADADIPAASYAQVDHPSHTCNVLENDHVMCMSLFVIR